jgi:hypothetical protein
METVPCQIDIHKAIVYFSLNNVSINIPISSVQQIGTGNGGDGV